MDSNYEVYSSKCDRKDIVDFIKQVEKYPCLYDKTTPEYANKFHNRKAWLAIAKRANTTVPDCRDKWRKIRISFMRSLKQQQSEKPPMRPYYLTEELHFLKPFIKVTSREAQSKEAMDYEVATVMKQDISEDETTDSREENEEMEREINTVTFPDNVIPNLNNGQVENGFVKKLNGVKNAYNNNDNECSARKMFLLSMLPDVESFSEQEMRIFRREVIDVIDSIINKRI